MGVPINVTSIVDTLELAILDRRQAQRTKLSKDICNDPDHRLYNFCMPKPNECFLDLRNGRSRFVVPCSLQHQ